MIKENEILVLVNSDGSFSTISGPLSEETLLDIIKSDYNISDFLVWEFNEDLDEIDLSNCSKINEEMAKLYINNELIYYTDTENAEYFDWLVKTEEWENFINQEDNEI